MGEHIRGPEFGPPTEAEFVHRSLNDALLARGQFLDDGHYLRLPTESFGEAVIDDHYAFSHAEYDDSDKLDPGTRKRLLSDCLTIVSLQFSRLDISFIFFRPKDLSSGFWGLDNARLLGRSYPPYRSLAYWLSSSKQPGQSPQGITERPLALPEIQEVLASLS